jgi:hypothetical protein
VLLRHGREQSCRLLPCISKHSVAGSDRRLSCEPAGIRSYVLVMRSFVRRGLAVAGVTLALASGCSNSDDGSTTAAVGAPSSSSSPAAAPATTLAPSPTTAPPTTVPAGPAVAEAGGWRISISAPTAQATIGPTFDLCYEVTGSVREAKIAFEVSLVLAATGTLQSKVTADAAVGRGSARLNLGTPDPRRYDMRIQALVDGQAVQGLAVAFGVLIGAPAPAGCS